MRNAQKTLLTFIFLFPLILATSRAQAPVDTAQQIVPHRINDTSKYNAPYVILISADGFRSDYVKLHKAKKIAHLARAGIHADYMQPSFPSVTFPNHYTIATGLYPSHHGIVSNRFWDEQRKAWYTMKAHNVRDSTWYDGLPIWVLAEQQGMLSASLFWVGSEAAIAGVRPTYYYFYHNKFTPKEKVDKVLNWLRLPDSTRPHLITLYFPQPDHAGHNAGPKAQETYKAVQSIDTAIDYLAREVKKLPLKNLNIILLSDHGMARVDTAVASQIPVPKILNKENGIIINAGMLFYFHAYDKTKIDSIFKRIPTSDQYEAYRVKDLPAHLHYSSSDDAHQRIGDMLLIAHCPKIFASPYPITSVGKHGYDPMRTPEMRAIFYAWGDNLKKKKRIAPFENIHVYPLVAELLGLRLTSNIDGKKEVLAPIIKK